MKPQLLIPSILCLIFSCQFALAVYAPLVLSSTKLIRGFTKNIENPRPNPFPLSRAEILIRKLVKKCSSDAYILINQPGLTYDDFKVNDHKIFFNLQSKLNEDSVVTSFPYVENGISFEKITKQILSACEDIEVIRINVEDEEELREGHQLPRYKDTKPRVIILNLPKLPTHGDIEYRNKMIHENDKYIRKVLQRIPSPYLSFIFTSLDTTINDEAFLSNHPKNMGVPLSSFKKISRTFDPMSWLTNDERRLKEEPIFREIDFTVAKNDDNIQRKNKYEQWMEDLKNEENEIRLISPEFYSENKGLVAVLGLVFVGFLMYIAIITVRSIVLELKTLLWKRSVKAQKSKQKKNK
ncbi:Big1 protein [Saccharomycopsis crataegensis]|uniref:Protein BIG1 n=1 Tax=Saccharomycopsis crataegensis TaxID=43959 RepID=A0AAV5QDN6_9ASCO|nr:Big1 protein [Saccharomycopsis crataegensis]